MSYDMIVLTGGKRARSDLLASLTLTSNMNEHRRKVWSFNRQNVGEVKRFWSRGLKMKVR